MRKEGFYRICRNYGIPAAYLFGSMRDAGVSCLESRLPGKVKDPLADIDLGVVFLERPFLA